MQVDLVEERIAHPVPYDENLLERARTQWQFGDWDSLAQLDRDALHHHPDRAKLALLAAAGRLQTRGADEARQFIRLAQDWGVSKTLLTRILVAGVHNSLGRSAAISGNPSRALTHFEESLAIGLPGSDLKLVTAARARYQLGSFGGAILASASVTLLAREKGHSDALAHTRPNLVATSANSATPASIVVAGMRHSGSTALFNLIRLALKQEGIPFTAGYSENAEHQQAFAVTRHLKLIKTHEFRDDIAYATSIVITTRRDLRDSVASAKRRGFSLLERVGGDIEYAKYNRSLHDIWLPHSDYVFEYERFMYAPVEETRKLFDFLGLEHANAEEIQKTVAALPTDRYQETLLSPTHITDPEHAKTYLDTLSGGVIEKINNDHARWLARYGYQ